MINYKTISHYRIPLLLAAIILILATLGKGATDLLQFHRTAVADGQLWRMLSANLVHLGWSHALLNTAGLLLLWALFGRYFTQAQWLLLLACSCIATTLGLLLFNADLQWYVGLSGALHGLFVAGCIAELRGKSRTGLILLLAVAGKLMWEQFQGPLPGSVDAAGGPVVVQAHLYGAVAGIVALFFKPPDMGSHPANP